MSKPTLTIRRAAALSATQKRLQFRSERELEENLEMAAGSLAEAYQIGAEEAQREIAQRLAELPVFTGGER